MDIDFTSSSWLAVAAWAQNELNNARRRNDGLDLSQDSTAATRGEIRTLKKLIGLPAAAARMQNGSAAAHPDVWDTPVPNEG